MERMTAHIGDAAPAGDVMDEGGSAGSQAFLVPALDLENPVDWLDSCFPVLFGRMGETGPARDLWDFIELDTLLAGNTDFAT